MTDDLDVLRSHRPEATGPSDDLQRSERSRFMTTIQDDTVHARTPRRRARLGGRRRLALAFAVGLVAVGGAAAGAGLIPDDVERALGIVGDIGGGSFAADTGEAVRRAAATTADGGTVELWTAPTRDGGACAFVRRLTASGAARDAGPVTCENELGSAVVGVAADAGTPSGGMTIVGAGGGAMKLQNEVAPDGSATVFGQSVGAARVVATDRTGGTVEAAATADGWFVLTGDDLVAIEARDASGQAIEKVSLEVPKLRAFDGATASTVGGAFSDAGTVGPPAP